MVCVERRARLETCLSLVCAVLALNSGCDGGDSKNPAADFVDGGNPGDAGIEPIDNDPPQNGPPAAYLATSAGWQTALGTVFDENAGLPGGTPCAEGQARFASDSSGSVGLFLANATADEILDELGVRSMNSDLSLYQGVGLEQDPVVRAFADALAVGPTSLNSFGGPSNITIGRIVFDGKFGEPARSCGSRFIEAIDLGARFSYGLKVEFDSEARKSMFIERFGKRGFLGLLGGPEVEAMEEFLTGHATLTTFAIQIGTNPSDLNELMAKSSCSVSELEGCRDLLDDLHETSNVFFDRLGEPTVDDYAGWAPMSLRVSDPVE